MPALGVGSANNERIGFRGVLFSRGPLNSSQTYFPGPRLVVGKVQILFTTDTVRSVQMIQMILYRSTKGI
jgi:hypothetical protein